MKGTMKVMGPSGHEETTWDTEVQETVEVAATTFARLLLSGHVGFVTSGDKPRKLEEFDPEAGRIVVVMPMAGG